MIIYTDDSKPVRWPKSDSHDPANETYYYIHYYPSDRSNSKHYTKGVDVIVPVTPNGCMYECISGGISSATTPVFPTLEEATFIDGDVLWKTLALTTRLADGDVITSSEWKSEAGVTLSSPSIVTNRSTEVKVTSVPTEATSFTLTNEINITYASGRTEKRKKSLIIPIKEL